MTSAMIFCSPMTTPYSATVALGEYVSAVHEPPLSSNPEHVRAMLIGLHVVLTCSHQPAVDSVLHARYGLAEAYAMWPLVLIHSYTLSGLPPWHEPASPPQFSTCWTARLISAPFPCLLILIRSPSAETVACAQHEPPNCEPCTSAHVNLVGNWCMARYVCGSGLHSPVQ